MKWPAGPSRCFRSGEILRPRIAFDSVRTSSSSTPFAEGKTLTGASRSSDSSGRRESGSKSLQAIFKDTLKQLRGFAVADAFRDEGTRPVDETPTFSRLLMHADRGQIVGDREWRLNDGVAVASSSVVEFLQSFDDGVAVWGGYMPDSASLGRLAAWGVRQPIRQRIKATNQLPNFIRRSGYIDACGCLCHKEVLSCWTSVSDRLAEARWGRPALASATRARTRPAPLHSVQQYPPRYDLVCWRLE